VKPVERGSEALRVVDAAAPATWPLAMEVVDSHTEGEPTRVVLGGWPQPEGDTMVARRAWLCASQDHLRRAVVCEPRGHAAVVGALVTPSVEPGSTCGVIFFDNGGPLGMCGHGLIGLVSTLAWLARIAPGELHVDTPAGTVSAQLAADGGVTLHNVPARVHALDVSVDVPGLGRITGDLAWGGNWFFLTELKDEAVGMQNLTRLTAMARAIRSALAQAGTVGAGGAAIDHVELFGAPSGPHADSRNFVLCPSGTYDRSPCGTGTSAKLAVLHARGQLSLGERWRQESVTGGMFEGWLSQEGDTLVPHIRGRAFVTGRATLHFDARDPLRGGIA
jgi:4-hydroxyproline epimerase